MNLDSPVELLRELEERAPFEFKVRDTRSDQLDPRRRRRRREPRRVSLEFTIYNEPPLGL